MNDILATEETFKDNASSEESVFEVETSQITELIPREFLQKAESSSPTSYPARAKSQILNSPTHNSSDRLEACSNNYCCATPKKISSVITDSKTPQRDTQEIEQKENLVSQSKEFSLISGLHECTARLNKEIQELCSNPLAYLKQGLDNIVESTIYCCRSFVKVMISIPRLMVSVVQDMSRFISKVVKSLLDSQNSGIAEIDTSRTYKPSWLSGAFFSSDSKVEALKQAHILNWLFSGKQELDQNNESGEKNFFDILLENLKKIASAIIEKEERREKKEKEEDLVEIQSRHVLEANENLKKAELLRPDLAPELELPQTEFILTSAFSEVPNVDALIDEALRKKATRSVT